MSRCKLNPCCGNPAFCKPPPQFRDLPAGGASASRNGCTEWIIRLRFASTEREAQQILEVVTDAIKLHGTVASLAPDEVRS